MKTHHKTGFISYPNRRIPARACTTTDAVQRLRDYGSVQRIGVNSGALPLNPWLQEEVLDFFDHNPKTSTREEEHRYHISHVNALRFLKKDKGHLLITFIKYRWNAALKCALLIRLMVPKTRNERYHLIQFKSPSVDWAMTRIELGFFWIEDDALCELPSLIA
ncbi:hypothetical protein EVAR_27151_1 [Eumeta japonica]|uniref:Uncharacterized protein n=1 Tax=Eumeta variegata TaxID=151549 RepID=A0A4C1VYV3_EUMVA|nr:hypothetical protein EVAR_27151_1 [Eumeta japonica]